METDSRRTVVVSGVPNVLPAGRMRDKLTIHFQRVRRSRGGDVDAVTYPTDMEGVAFVTFDEAEDAAGVVEQEEQIMEDEEFLQNYRLTVFPFNRDVFLYVPHATVDLSSFGGDQDSLIRSLRSSHRSIRFQSLPSQRSATIEGPFSAVQALREDLTCRAHGFKSSPGAAGLHRREPSPHRRREASQASQRAAEMSSCQKDSQDGSGHENEQNRYKMSGKHRTEPSKPGHREVVGGENKMVSSSSRLKETSTRRQRPETSSEGRTSVGNHVDPNMGSLKNPSSSVAAATSPLMGRRHTSTATKQRTEDIWVDLYTFMYINRFHRKDLGQLLDGMDVIPEANGLVRLSVREKRPSKASSMEKLKTFIDSWLSNLRINEMFYDEARGPSKQKLTQISEKVNSSCDPVLYFFEDSCIKFIGPPTSSLQFFVEVKNEMEKHEKLYFKLREGK